MNKWPPKDQLVIGVHSVRELLEWAPDRLLQIFTTRSRTGDLVKLCEKEGIPIVFVSEEELTRMSGSDSHQSIAAQIKRREFLDVREFLKLVEDRPDVFVLMIDQIFDPQNFGAILRSAECFGVDGVVFSKNRGADLTPIAAKASSGASEIIPLIRISNLADSVHTFQKAGFEVVAAVLEPSSESAYTFRYGPKTVLIVGSEGEGIQPLIRKKANRSIYIPLSGKVESLNVAQASAVLLALRAASTH